MAEMSDAEVEKLLQPDSGIVRHKGKIQSAIHNARLVLEIQKEHGSLAAYLWGLMPDKRPIVNTYKCVVVTIHVQCMERMHMQSAGVKST